MDNKDQISEHYKAILAIDLVCKSQGLEQSDVFAKSRKLGFKTARQMIYYLVLRNTNLNFRQVGELGGGYTRDRATIIHANRVFTGNIEFDRVMNKKVTDLEKRLRMQISIKNLEIRLRRKPKDFYGLRRKVIEICRMSENENQLKEQLALIL